MKVCVFTATKRYGGLDVTYGALRAQTHQDFVWMVADELCDERRDVFMEKTSDLDLRRMHWKPRDKPEGYYSDLPAIYNAAIGIAEAIECELFVSLQDFIWIPEYGLERFVQAAEQEPRSIVAGLCSMAAVPDADAVSDPKGLWSLFAEDYPGYDDDPIEWHDVRMMQYRPGALVPADPVSWEMNWAAFPTSVGPLFDEKYGKHIGNENAQFAWSCERKGHPIRIDAFNHAISLPHRHYFADEWAEQQPHRDANMEQYRQDWAVSEEHRFIGEGGNI